MEYLLSIIVPTKNRYKYLKSIIDTFKSMDSGEVQLVIQDNSSDNSEIIEYLKEKDTKNIKYNYIKEHVSVSENFNTGILHSDGDYICMIGDDDSVSSNILDIVKYMDKNEIESAVFNKATYYWPDMEFRAHKMPSLTVPDFSNKVLRIDSLSELNKCLKKGATSLLTLPQIYHGIVKRNVLDQIFEKCSTYFPGASPDMAIAIALSLIVKNHVFIDAPYTISGQAYNSAGGSGARNSHKGKLKDIKWLPEGIEEKWEKKVPMIWTGATIYAESAHKALRSMNRNDLLEKFNYAYLYAWFLSFNREYKSILKETIKLSLVDKIKVMFIQIRIFILRSTIFIKNILKTKFGITTDQVFYNIDTSDTASIIVTNSISGKYYNNK